MKKYTHRGPGWRNALVAGGAGAFLLSVGVFAQESGSATSQQQQQQPESAQGGGQAMEGAQQDESQAADQTVLGQPGQASQNMGSVANTYIVGTIQGTIHSVDLNKATVTINTMGGALGQQGQQAGKGKSASAGQGAQTVTLQARPFDLANLNPGDVVALQYNDYGGSLWLAPQEGQGGQGQMAQSNQSWSQYGRLTGAVSAVDRAKGTITVRGQEFRLHPQQTQGIFPGQFISVSFAQIGQTPWVSEIQSGPIQQQQAGSAQGSGGAQQ